MSLIVNDIDRSWRISTTYDYNVSVSDVSIALDVIDPIDQPMKSYANRNS